MMTASNSSKKLSIYFSLFLFLLLFLREKTLYLDNVWLHPCVYPCVFAAGYSKWCISLVLLRDTPALCALPGFASLPLPAAQVLRWSSVYRALCAGRKVLSAISADHCYTGGSELPGEQLHFFSCLSADTSQN